jgi:glycosyltransferase involved in cell wall biosynthesis
VRLFPHPVSLPAELSAPSRSSAQTGDAAITITCPGFARYEKGNDLLQEACRQLFSAESPLDLQVISQWPQPFSLPDGSQAAPDPDLLASGRYQLLNESLNREAYADLLARSDLIVLPYRRSSYHNRVSRVAIEAALHGIPLVFMSGTWCEEVVELTGAGVAIADETPEAVAEALRSALRELPELRQRAQQARPLVEERYSAGRFLQLLLEC